MSPCSRIKDKQQRLVQRPSHGRRCLSMSTAMYTYVRYMRACRLLLNACCIARFDVCREMQPLPVSGGNSAALCGGLGWKGVGLSAGAPGRVGGGKVRESARRHPLPAGHTGQGNVTRRDWVGRARAALGWRLWEGGGRRPRQPSSPGIRAPPWGSRPRRPKTHLEVRPLPACRARSGRQGLTRPSLPGGRAEESQARARAHKSPGRSSSHPSSGLGHPRLTRHSRDARDFPRETETSDRKRRSRCLSQAGRARAAPLGGGEDSTSQWPASAPPTVSISNVPLLNPGSFKNKELSFPVISAPPGPEARI
ncbi:uncharacterized protein LOC127544650 isoform X2 [Antechinus flavipes]|nr:uncharacterized protein LOC127544650 isoform X2 [Antechinus flavipes]